MTTDEILNFYKFAKDPPAEVVILSELTLKPVEKIISIIREAGYTVDESKIPHTELQKWYPWTKDEDKRLLELRAKGLTFKQIGDLMLRTRNSVHSRYDKITRGIVNA